MPGSVNLSLPITFHQPELNHMTLLIAIKYGRMSLPECPRGK